MTTALPLIGLTGDAPWLATVSDHLAAGGFDVVRYPADDVAHLITRLIDDYPALLIVDGDLSGWRERVAAVKTEQATRRLPILVVADSPQDAELVRQAGADGALSADNFAAEGLAWVRDHARLPDPAMIAELECQCGQPLPPLGQEGIRKFNAGAYYAQHDTFEALWMAERGPVRDLYRAILQVGVAYYHLTHGNPAGALKMLRRSVQWFVLLPDTCQGVNVRQLREDAAAVRAALEALDPAERATLDRALLKPVQHVETP